MAVTVHPDGFLVGDPAGGDFVTMPEVGMVIIDALSAGRSVAEAAERARDRIGEEVDIDDFVDTLIELGFVSEIDGQPVPDVRDQRRDGGRIGEWLARAGRPLFSRAAWAIYGALFIASALAMALAPSLRVWGSDLLFLHHDPLDSIAIMAVLGMLLAGLHECAHWLAARVQGIPARIGVSRRWYFLVLQTEMTGIWALPRQRRLSPLLAGMAFDTLCLDALLVARITAEGGVWHPSSVVSRLIMALIATTVAGLVFQCFIFMRTDLYAVLITWLGCGNLTQVTRWLIGQRLPWLRARATDELAEASGQDLRVAWWYRWIYVGGMIGATWFFVAFFGPNILTVARAAVADVAHSSPLGVDFWRGLVLGTLALAPVPLTLLVFIRERCRPRAGSAAHGGLSEPAVAAGDRRSRST